MKEINALAKNDEKKAKEEFIQLIRDLHSEREFEKILELSRTANGKKFKTDIFEIAYAYRELDYNNEAEKIYKEILKKYPDNVAVLNNLTLILEEKNGIRDAFYLIEKAYALEPEDEVVKNNYQRIEEKIAEVEASERMQKNACLNLEDENEFVRAKLNEFIYNVEKDPGYKNEEIYIANWKFKVLMKTNEGIADSLKIQWLEKGYIIDLGKRDSRYVKCYKLNPFLKKSLEEIKQYEINKNWIENFESVNKLTLMKIDYFKNKVRLNKAKSKYRDMFLRDYDEIVLNYIFKNSKSTIILAGSLVEMLLIYYCEKKKVKIISYTRNNKKVSKNIYDVQLNDLLLYFDENNIFSKQLFHLGNITRIYRNFIHPGRELKESNKLAFSQAEICYQSLNEIIKTVIR